MQYDDEVATDEGEGPDSAIAEWSDVAESGTWRLLLGRCVPLLSFNRKTAQQNTSNIFEKIFPQHVVFPAKFIVDS